MLPLLNLSESTSEIYLQFLQRLKQSTFSGDIQHDFGTRLVTATDNSIYQVLPQAVLYPKNTSDVQTALKLASEDNFKNIKLTPRGGGTGTNGQSLSEAVILDCSKYMNEILETNLEEGWVRVEPGVVLDQLNDHLAPNDVFFAPNLSPSSRATLGGMVNTDACGQGSRVYGRTSDHLLELSCVLANGEQLHSIPLNQLELEKYKQASGVKGEIYKVVDKIVTEKSALIQQIFPKMSRFMTGYNLAKVYDNGDNAFNLNYLISGSEGTLTVLTEAKLKLTPLPKFKQLLVVKYESFKDALGAAEILVKSDPTAIETIDEKILGLAREDEIYLKVKDFICDEGDRPTKTINLVEFSGNDPLLIDKKVKQLCQTIETEKAKPGSATGFYHTSDPVQIRDLWNLRKKGVGLLGNTKGDRKPLPFLEDTAVPPENLAAYIQEFRDLLESYGLQYAMFGHVDVGCLHVRPALDLKKPEEEIMIRELSDQVVLLVKKYGGIMWAEHGRGFRSEYTEDFFGEELYQDLRRIKEAFDPHNRLNPGKIVTPFSNDTEKVVPLEGPLRGQYDRQIIPELRKEFDAAISCNGNGACFDYAPDHVMCPTSRYTKDRIHSPKGRVSLLREWLRQLSIKGYSFTAENLSEDPELTDDIKSKLTNNRWNNTRLKNKGEYDFSHEVYHAMQGCLACKACATQCPIHVDVPEFRSKFLDIYHQRYLRPPKDYVVGATEQMGRFLSLFPTQVNLLLNSSWNKYLMKKFIGLQDVPNFSSETVRQRLRQSHAPEFNLGLTTAQNTKHINRNIVLLQDAFTSFYESQVVMDCYDLFVQLGYTVYVAPFHPNGKPLHIKGFLGAFKKVAQQNTKWLSHVAQSGMPMIGIDPSVVLTYRDEYPKILNSKELPFEVMLPQEFLVKDKVGFKDKLPENSKISGTKKAYKLLGHCSEKTGALLSQQQWKQVYSIFGLNLTLLESGCCGMAGTFGHETEHVEESRGIYEMSWKKKIPQDSLMRQQILATGFSCRSQVKRMEGFRPMHPAQALLREIL